jgi:hypothetical protein
MKSYDVPLVTSVTVKVESEFGGGMMGVGSVNNSAEPLWN